jgi:hypothetical protein
MLGNKAFTSNETKMSFGMMSTSFILSTNLKVFFTYCLSEGRMLLNSGASHFAIFSFAIEIFDTIGIIFPPDLCINAYNRIILEIMTMMA